jgi:hypothetical protein
MASMMMLARNSRRHCLQQRRCPDVATMTLIRPTTLGTAVQPHVCRSFAAASSSLDGLQKTALFEWHQQQGGGADMVPFAGYALPVLYKNLGVMKEHLWCREKASLFDVSHMGQVQRFFIYALLFVNNRMVFLSHTLLFISSFFIIR